MMDPESALKEYMAGFGLYPPSIRFDGKVHRFDDPEGRKGNKGAWYSAFPDQRGAVFGCWCHGRREVWQVRDGKWESLTPEQRDQLRAEQDALEEKREAAQRAQQAAVAAECRARWAAAAPADLSHPYLKRKGITSIDSPKGPLVRQEGDLLLLPMRRVDKEHTLVSLQTISREGVKLFVAGGEVKGTRLTIGSQYFKKDHPLYIAEGFATAWTISHRLKAPVIVAWDAYNLRPVAQHMRRSYPETPIVIAADNDRWTVLKRHGREDPNPGVTLAREAADSVAEWEDEDGTKHSLRVAARVAIPDFQDATPPRGEKKGPTDFNDLYLREGDLAVRRWIDPERAHEAQTIDAAAMVSSAGPAAPTGASEPEGSAASPTPDGERGTQHPPAARAKPARKPQERAKAAPASTPQATATATATAPAEPPPAEAKNWLEAAPFRPLGYDQGVFYYLPTKGTGQLVRLRAREHDKKNLKELAPLSWWGEWFPSEKGPGWEAIADGLLRASERQGVYHPERLRGTGAWVTRTDGPVLHLGDRLLFANGDEVSPERYRGDGDAIFEKRKRLDGPVLNDPMSVDEAREILGLFGMLRWRQQHTAPLIAAGWAALAPLGGALEWRPHIWITGHAGSGKSTVIEQMLRPLMGDVMLFRKGVTSEANVRQSLKSDAKAVLLDEAEATGKKQAERVQALLGLARDASSETSGTVGKGTVSGTPMEFIIRSMFAIASIGGAVREEADKTRIAMLQLRSRDDGDAKERQAQWRELEHRLVDLDQHQGRRLLARTWGLLPQLIGRDGWIRIFRRAATSVLGDARAGDQYGTLYAGAWTMMSDEAPTVAEAEDLIRSESLEEYIEDQIGDGIKALRILFGQLERVENTGQPRTHTIEELVHAIVSGLPPHKDVSIEDCDRVLRQRGLKVSNDRRDLFVANNNEWIGRVLRETPYGDSWKSALLGIPGAALAGTVRFTPLITQKAVGVPLARIIQ